MTLTTREALLLVLDQVDYTKGACGLTEMVGACLDARIIREARAALAADGAHVVGIPPLEPTEEMVKACSTVLDAYAAKLVWKRMYLAAPASPSPAQERSPNADEVEQLKSDVLEFAARLCEERAEAYRRARAPMEEAGYHEIAQCAAAIRQRITRAVGDASKEQRHG
jgi:hypothetical protein